jgi:hypothetical protein
MDTFYFSHDYTARSDEKIKQLIRRHGMTGYGIYWAIVEDLYQNANALRIDCDGIAYDLRADCEMVRSVLFDFELFVHDGGKFGSHSVQRRLDQRNEKSKKARESASYRWNNANALQTKSDRNAIKESKVKESKVNETKEDNTDVSPPAPVRVKREVFRPPTLEEVKNHAAETMSGSRDAPEAFHDYYTSNGWKVGRNPMKDWKAAYKNWIKRESNGTYQQSISRQSTGETKTERDARAWEDFGKDYLEGRRTISTLFGFDENRTDAG